MSGTPDNLTCKEAAARLRVSCRTLEKWRQEGKGPPFIRFGKSYLYRREAIEKFERSHEFTSGADYRSRKDENR